jgi:hypothetical protein
LQKLGSFAYDNIKAEYIDYVFNRMGDQYITEKTTRRNDPKQAGFEDNITRLSTIQELITESSITVFNQTTNRRQYSLLPFNYLSFVEAEANILASCTNDAVVPTNANITEYVSIVPFKASNFVGYTGNPFANTIVYKTIATVDTAIFTFSDYASSLSDIEEIFTVINLITQEINRTQTDIKVYWQYYRDTYAPDSFIFVSTSATYASQSMKVQYYTSATGTGSFTSTVYTRPTTATGSFAESFTNCRLLSNEETYHIQQNPFGKSAPESPIINIKTNKIEIYIDERFILKGLTLKYIRKPRRMSLPLNQSYEIQDIRALEKIIDMTVEYLSATIESQGYQALTLENQQRD